MAFAPPKPIGTFSILRRLNCALLFILALLLTVSPEVTARPLVILSDSTTSYQKVLNTLREYSGVPVDYMTADALRTSPMQLQRETYDYYISVGSRATDTLLKHLPDNAPSVLATFIPRRSYQSLLRTYDDHPVVNNKRISAIYLDQPYNRQLRLARLISPKADVIGAAFSDLSARDLPLLEETLNETGLTLEYRVLDEDKNPIKQLQPLLEKSDIFLTLPDKAVFNRTTAKWILYISFRLRVPLLGFSRKYVEAGAVAGIYSSATQIGRQTGEAMVQFNLKKHVLPSAQYPMYFSVATNPSAAKRLRIHIPAEAELEQALKEAEQ